jgi:hypothetical protein
MEDLAQMDTTDFREVLVTLQMELVCKSKKIVLVTLDKNFTHKIKKNDTITSTTQRNTQHSTTETNASPEIKVVPPSPKFKLNKSPSTDPFIKLDMVANQEENANYHN